MANDKVQVQIEAVDKATEELKKVNRELEQLRGKGEQVGKVIEKNSSSNQDYEKSIVTANLKTLAITQTLGFLHAQYQRSIELANEYQRNMTGLSSTAAAFNLSQVAARTAAQSLANDGLVSVATSAKSLQSLLTTGIGLDKAINLMNAYKDQAALGRASSLSMEQAVGNLAESFLTESSAVGNLSGQSENYNQILERGANALGKKVSALTDAERQEAKYIGTMQLAKVVQGDSALAAQSAEAAQNRLNMQIETSQRMFGQALSPAVQYAIEQLTNFATSMNGEASPALKNLAKGLVIFVGGVKVFANTIVQLGALVVDTFRNIWNAGKQVLTGDFKGAFSEAFGKEMDAIKGRFGNIVQTIGDTGQEMQAKVDNIENHFGELPNVFKAPMAKAAEAVQKGGEDIVKKLSKVREDIDKEMANYARSMEEKTRNFSESMRDIVIQHRNAIGDIRKDITNLTDDFNKSTSDRLSEHSDKKAEIEQQYADETKTLSDNLARRLSENIKSDDQLTAFFQAQLAAKEAQKQEALRKEDEKYAAEEAKQLAAHTKQLTELQTKLNAELEIEKKHRAEFEQFKDAVQEDDITRLQQSFEREMGELKRQHDERMTELRKEQEEILAVKATAAAEAAKKVEQSAKTRTVTVTTPKVTKSDPNKEVYNRGNEVVAQSALQWIDLPKYHDGGMVPGNGEVPILARGGETVLTQQQSQSFIEILKNMGLGAQSSLPNLQMTNNIYNQVDLVGAMREMGWRARIR